MSLNKRKIKDLFKFLPKAKHKAGEGLEEGTYPFYTSSAVVNKYFDEYDYEPDKLIFATGGSASVHYANSRFAVSTDNFILEPNEDVNAKYVYYYLKSNIQILQDGFHGAGLQHLSKDYLNEVSIPILDRTSQEKVVFILDKADEIRAKKKLANDKLDEFLKSTFISMFGDVNINPHNFKKITLNDVAKEIFAGGDKPADNCKMKDDIYKYPVYSNGDKNDGLLCYSKTFRVDNLAITVSARGSIGFCKIRQPYFTPVVRLITMIPNEEISIIYLKHFIDNISFTTTGSSQVQLTVPEFKKKYILVPPIELQNKFAQIVEKIEVQKQKNELVIEQMDNLFNSLSQRAFKGEL